MQFGLRNTASIFQRFIDEVFRGLNLVFAYVDDFLMASDTEENHIKHLSQLFERLSACHVRINEDAPLSLRVDPSDLAIGSVLQQSVNGITQPLAFFSCLLKPAERWYNTFNREFLAIYLSVNIFD